MKNIILLKKKEGETPLAALLRFKERNKKYKNVKMTYAGRLDPLVSGLLLILAGDTTKEKEKYLGLSKEYKFEILFGFATDTYDILGKVLPTTIRTNSTIEKNELERKIKQNLKYFTGKFMQKYPMYSSKTVDGKPLFAYARAGKVVESPEREVRVSSLKLLKIRTLSAQKFLQNIERRVAKVKGDFRQKEILKIWRIKLNKSKEKFSVASFYIKCGSGTYVRSIANDFGQKIGLPSLALSIKRTKIGKYE